MSLHWSALPGFARYCSRVMGSLEAGQSAVLCIPRHCPSDLVETLRRVMAERLDVVFSEVDPACLAAPEDPVELLYRTFARLGARGSMRDLRTLVTHEGFAGRTILLGGFTVQSWPKWRDLLEQHGSAAQEQDPSTRTTFLCILEQEATLLPPKEDIHLSVHFWEGGNDPVDLMAYTNWLLAGRPLTPLCRAFLVHLAAELAQWDCALCEELARGPVANALDPVRLLQEMGRARGWDQLDGFSGGHMWLNGVASRRDGSSEPHSAFLALSALPDHKRLLRLRTWRGMLRAVFPFIEEQRHRLIDKHASLLTVPYETAFATVTDIRDLEVSHLENQLRPHLRNRERRRLALLRDMRNSLAHSDIPSVATVESFLSSWACGRSA